VVQSFSISSTVLSAVPRPFSFVGVYGCQLPVSIIKPRLNEDTASGSYLPGARTALRWFAIIFGTNRNRKGPPVGPFVISLNLAAGTWTECQRAMVRGHAGNLPAHNQS